MTKLLLTTFSVVFSLFLSYAETVKIIHVNDSHSHMDTEKVKDMNLGGMVNAATVIKQLEKDNPSALVLHAGDSVQGTIYYNLFKGRAEADVLNSLNFDAMTIGNHEFDDGDAQLAQYIGMLKFPVISSNVSPAKGNVLEGKFKPYIIKNGIGIIGITPSKKTKRSSSPSAEIDFKDEAKSVQKYVNELKAKGIRRIVVLSHYGYENDLELAGKVTDIDVIVGGDSHTLLGDFSAYDLKSSGAYPTMRTNKDKEPVCIVQAWEYGKVVGELDVDFDKDALRSCSGTPHLIKAGNPDAETVRILSKYSEQIDGRKNTVIGKASGALTHRRMPAGSDPNSGSEVVPLVAQAFYESSKRADFSIQNAGGVRTSIPEGDITIGFVYELLPFSNTLYEVELSGSEVKQLLEDQMQSGIDKGSHGGFPYAYALRYDADGTKPSGERISGIEIKDRATGIWKPLDMNRTYVSVTNSFLMNGKDSYKVFENARTRGTDTYIEYADCFISYVKRRTAAGQTITKLPPSEYPVKSFIAP